MNLLPRQVKFRTKFELLKHRPQRLIQGIFFIGFSTMFLMVSLFLTQSFRDRSVPDVDDDEIAKSGTTTIGHILDIAINQNITDNGNHPAVITYRYKADGQEITSKYQILAPNEVDKMKVGDEIEVKYLYSQSILSGFESYSFPSEVFALFSIPFFLIGLWLTSPSIISFRKHLNLYRYGKILDAELVLMVPKSGVAPWDFGLRIEAHYKYRTSSGEIILGESVTTDLSIINEKKQGDIIKIFVSEQDESKSAVIPKVEAIRNDWGIVGIDK